MPLLTRRRFLQSSAAVIAAAHAWPIGQLFAQQDRTLVDPGERPPKADGVVVENPMLRVPVSLIIDDSTCLVNLAHFAIPQFAEIFPDNYKQPWKLLPGMRVPSRSMTTTRITAPLVPAGHPTTTGSGAARRAAGRGRAPPRVPGRSP